jgi:hypothetical protein
MFTNNLENKLSLDVIDQFLFLTGCLKRQSARSKSEEPEQCEDFFEIHDAKFPVSPQIDDSVHETGQMALALSIKREDEGNTALSLEAQEIRRSSVGRPLRRAAEKIQSYKEIPINLKMRRME